MFSLLAMGEGRRPPKGSELAGLREAAGIEAHELGDAMGVSRARVSQIEGLARVTPLAYRHYMDALVRISQVATTRRSSTGEAP